MGGDISSDRSENFITTKISSNRIGELPWHISSRHCGWEVNMEIVVSMSTSTDFMCLLSLDAVLVGFCLNKILCFNFVYFPGFLG